MFERFKKAALLHRLEEEQLYEHVVNEVSQGLKKNGLWGKALANSDGNEQKAKSLYIKYRVQSLKDEFKIKGELQKAEELEDIQNERWYKEQQRRNEEITKEEQIAKNKEKAADQRRQANKKEEEDVMLEVKNARNNRKARKSKKHQC